MMGEARIQPSPTGAPSDEACPASRRLRLLFVSIWHPSPPDNGSRVRVHELLAALSRRHELSLVTFAPPAGPAEDPVAQGLCNRCTVVPRHPFAKDERRRRWALLGATPRDYAAMHAQEMDEAVDDAWRRDGPFDAVIASTVQAAPYALRGPGAPRILEEHNFLAKQLEEQAERETEALRRARRRLAAWKDRRYERDVFSRFDLVTMVSEEDRRAVEEAGCAVTRIEVVPNGARLDSNPVHGPGSGRVDATLPGRLVFQGAPTYAPNLDAVRWFADSVLPLLRARMPEAELLVTGRAEGLGLDELATREGLRFSGYVEDLPSLLRRRWACVVPLRSGGGTRLKVLEALALGLPVVSTAKGVEGLGLVAEQDYLPADDPEAFVRQLLRLAEIEGLRDRLVARGRTVVAERFDWREIGAAFVDLVEGAAGMPGAPPPEEAQSVSA